LKAVCIWNNKERNLALNNRVADCSKFHRSAITMDKPSAEVTFEMMTRICALEWVTFSSILLCHYSNCLFFQSVLSIVMRIPPLFCADWNKVIYLKHTIGGRK